MDLKSNDWLISAIFDICKGSDRIAQLRLLKSVCRLGEVITGVIDFSRAIIQSYQLSISLESSETVHPDFISPYKSSTSISNLSKRVVAEYHSFVGNTQKMPISLSIPVNATPEFATNAGE
ncbi:reduced growth phenotype protein 1 [Paraphysoderma sedebokerense]|nr:reduced growth phenotype protein 1 [Paraphysoderma sedebokerense]